MAGQGEAWHGQPVTSNMRLTLAMCLSANQATRVRHPAAALRDALSKIGRRKDVEIYDH